MFWICWIDSKPTVRSNCLFLKRDVILYLLRDAIIMKTKRPTQTAIVVLRGAVKSVLSFFKRKKKKWKITIAQRSAKENPVNVTIVLI